MLDGWRNTVLGVSDKISAENERLWRANLQSICEGIAAEGHSGKAKAGSFAVGSDAQPWAPWMKSNIESLWREQIVVADLLLQSIQDGVEF